jgi:hypothetical protein
MDETAVFKYVSDLIQSGELSGSCTAKEYVPESFQHQQRQAVDEYFTLYGIIESQKLTSVFGVSHGTPPLPVDPRSSSSAAA